LVKHKHAKAPGAVGAAPVRIGRRWFEHDRRHRCAAARGWHQGAGEKAGVRHCVQRGTPSVASIRVCAPPPTGARLAIESYG
jgi:hypothetical protein